jgi:hypothetical protein
MMLSPSALLAERDQLRQSLMDLDAWKGGYGNGKMVVLCDEI